MIRATVRRIIIRASVFLLLGAIVNIAVAWGCAMWSDHDIDTGREVFWEEGTELRFGRLFEGFGFTGVWLSERRQPSSPQPVRFFRLDRSSLPPWCFAFETDLRDIPIRWYSEDYAAGWPSLSMRSRLITDRVWFLHTDSVQAHGCIRLPDQRLPNGRIIRRALPLQVIWPGFAIDALFYAAILWGGWGLFAAPFALRRRRRIKRGLCPKCAYDLRGCASQNCPECGAEVIKQKAETQKAEMT